MKFEIHLSSRFNSQLRFGANALGQQSVSGSGFVPSALRPNPASQDFRYARNVIRHFAYEKMEE